LIRLSDDPNLLRRRARRRLVGAIALVVLAVVVLPVVLDQKPRSGTQELTVQIPSQDGGPFKTRVLPPLQTPPEQKTEAVPAKTTEDKPASTEAARPAPAKKEAAKPAERPRTKSKTADAFVFQLGVFTNPDNAKQVRDRAASAGVRSYTEQLKGQQGDQTRVRAGPFPSRGAAEKARDKLKSLGMDVGQVAQK
jgi:DedD protein